MYNIWHEISRSQASPKIWSKTDNSSNFSTNHNYSYKFSPLSLIIVNHREGEKIFKDRNHFDLIVKFRRFVPSLKCWNLRYPMLIEITVSIWRWKRKLNDDRTCKLASLSDLPGRKRQSRMPSARHLIERKLVKHSFLFFFFNYTFEEFNYSMPILSFTYWIFLSSFPLFSYY